MPFDPRIADRTTYPKELKLWINPDLTPSHTDQEARRWDKVQDVLRDICLFPGQPNYVGMRHRDIGLRIIRLRSTAVKLSTTYAGRFSVYLESQGGAV